MNGRSPLRSAVGVGGTYGANAARGSPGKFANERASPPNPAFDREMARVRRRVADEYEHERFGTRPVHVHASAQAREFTPSVWSVGGHRAHGGSYDAGRYYDAGGSGGIDDDPGESGYADFKLVAAAFRVWVRHASALRALRVAREAAVEDWMISVNFWECQTLKRGLERWRGRRNVMQLHALRFWYGEALRARFAQWRDALGAAKKARAEEKVNFKRALALWSGKNLSESFSRWRSATQKRNAFHGGTLLLASKSRRARMLRAWCVEAARSAALGAIGGDVEAQRKHRIKVLFYVKWRAAFHEKQRRREVMTRVAQRMRQRHLSGAFLGWRAKVDELLDTRAKLTGIAARFANQKLNAAFNKWSEYAANAAAEKEKIRSVMARLLNGAAIRCLVAWKEFALEQARLEEVCRKVARRVVMIAAATSGITYGTFGESIYTSQLVGAESPLNQLYIQLVSTAMSVHRIQPTRVEMR